MTGGNDSALYIDTGSESFTVGFSRPVIEGDPERDTGKCVACPSGVSCMKQVHGGDVMVVDAPGQYVCDGIFTRRPGLAVVVKTADCMPILLHSEAEGISGAVHMGWRSAKEGIIGNIPFGLSSFSAVIGVGMKCCCYQVGPEFMEHAPFRPYLSERAGKYYFDPVGFAVKGLMSKGIARDRIMVRDECSICSRDGYHSHRRTGTKSRTLSFVVKHK